jgi:NTE family protein
MVRKCSAGEVQVRSAYLLLTVGAVMVISTGCTAMIPAAATPTIAIKGQHALVLGGGGVTARGWELGLLKGLRDAGLELLDGDLVVGTSAGAFLGIQLLSGKPLDTLYQAALSTPTVQLAPGPPLPYDDAYFQETRQLWTNASADTVARRAEIGQRARTTARVIPEDVQLRITTTSLGDIHDWPTAEVRITAVDVDDGTVRFFTHADGVPLARVLAAGTAQPARVAPIAVGDHRYMDGGVAGTNLDGATGYARVLAITPGAGPKTEQEVAALQAAGSEVLVIAPDTDSESARGQDTQDVTRLRPSAEAGYRQATAVIAQARALWKQETSAPER